MNKFYLVEIARGDEFTEGTYNTLDEAVEAAKHTWTCMTDHDRDHTVIEVRQYKEDIESEDCTCFDYETFPWLTTGDIMKEKGGNLSWCIPYTADGGKIAFAVNEGECVGMIVDGENVEYNDPEVIKAAAKRANDDYEMYEGRTDMHILVEASVEEDCRDCPFFDECEAMGEFQA